MIAWRPSPVSPKTWLLGYRDGELVASIIADDKDGDRLLLRKARGEVLGYCEPGDWRAAKDRFGRGWLEWAQTASYEWSLYDDEGSWRGYVVRIQDGELYRATTPDNEVLSDHEQLDDARSAVEAWAETERLPAPRGDKQEEPKMASRRKNQKPKPEADQAPEEKAPEAAAGAKPEETIDGSASAEDDKSLETRPTTRNLRCVLDRDELLQRADRAAHIVAEHDRRQAESDAAKKQAKAELDRLEAEYRALNQQIRDRAEYRMVDCDEIRNYRTWTITIIRKDTGEQVDERAMTLDERRAAQTEMRFGEDGEGEPEGAEEGDEKAEADDTDDATNPEATATEKVEPANDAEPEKPKGGRRRSRRGNGAAEATAS